MKQNIDISESVQKNTSCEKHIFLPADKERLKALNSGDIVLLSGEIYVARDQAHKRICESLKTGGNIPISLTGESIYYMGPSPAKPGDVIGSCGPTSSYRMGDFAAVLIKKGLRVIVGKGKITDNVKMALAESGGVYFAAVGGAAALTSLHVISSEMVAYEDLGPEAICRLKIKDLPVITAYDTKGRDIFEEGPKAYLKEDFDVILSVSEKA